MSPIRVLLADDHPLFRDGVARTLSETGDFIITGEAASADEAVHLAATTRPDLILLDISMPGGGLSALAQIRKQSSETKIAMLTVCEEDDNLMQALKSGANGYLLKGIGGRELISIVTSIAEGRSYVSPTLAMKVLASIREVDDARTADPIDTLTKREEDILRLVSQGMSNREVGARLDIQERTVKHYMTCIMQKLNVRNRTEAALIARDRWNK